MPSITPEASVSHMPKPTIPLDEAARPLALVLNGNIDRGDGIVLCVCEDFTTEAAGGPDSHERVLACRGRIAGDVSWPY
ncbi:hypothetical protein [Bradyrhizobium sp. Ai1a-2]|uniref:hypothetical protein n=1 Tax=Bradyrhizobium sp. Ai1a-2 TaxID=196490 RepID=UPI0012697631|nr:hypothetical protein [Bradyrhizobium sp. Ai1a-2]